MNELTLEVENCSGGPTAKPANPTQATRLRQGPEGQVLPATLTTTRVLTKPLTIGDFRHVATTTSRACSGTRRLNQRLFKPRFLIFLSSILTLGGSVQANAVEIYSDAADSLSATLSAGVGVMHSEKNYALTGTKDPGSSLWQEGYVRYGFQGSRHGYDHSTLYGAINWESTGTWGDGDAAGFTDGTERRTRTADAYLGWRSGDVIPTLGKDGVDFSMGRQDVIVGDGFLINGDGVNFGKGFAGGLFNRGGAYYLAGRNDFAQTAVLKLGTNTSWRSDLMWLKSKNPGQAKPGFFVATLSHDFAPGTAGLTYIKVANIDDQLAQLLYPDRGGMKVYEATFNGDFGIRNLSVTAGSVKEHTVSNRPSAWYASAGWTFSDTAWSPGISYRYSHFSKNYDPLLFGDAGDFGTWAQGEVAADYVGPFNSNANVQHVAFKVNPNEKLEIGVLLFKFKTIDTSSVNNDGYEGDVFATWTANSHLSVSPLIGLYKPRYSAAEGGTQLGDNNSNLYSELLVYINF